MNKKDLNKIIKEEVNSFLAEEASDNISIILAGKDFDEVREIIYTATILLTDYQDNKIYARILKIADKWDDIFRKLSSK